MKEAGKLFELPAPVDHGSFWQINIGEWKYGINKPVTPDELEEWRKEVSGFHDEKSRPR